MKQPRGDNPAHPTMQVTGCVERGVIAGSFVLTQVDGSGSGDPVGTGPNKVPEPNLQTPQGWPATAMRTTRQPRPTLRSLNRGSDLGKFVGKRVAVTGGSRAIAIKQASAPGHLG